MIITAISDTTTIDCKLVNIDVQWEYSPAIQYKCVLVLLYLHDILNQETTH